MKHKEKECTWAPGMQDTDVTFAGDHTWATILRARKDSDEHRGAPVRLFILLGLGVIALGLGLWWMA